MLSSLFQFNIHLFYSYDRTLIRAIVTTGYIGWAVYNALLILPYFKGFEVLHHVETPNFSRLVIRIISVGVFVVTSILFMIHQSPLTYYAYILFPIYFWGEILIRSQAYYRKIQLEAQRVSVSLILKKIAIAAALLSMVVSL